MKKLVKIRLIHWHYLSNETVELKGNTLLTGPNASGKSTIMDAITYVLTAGDTAFNLAANEKGKRDLRGYVKCKLGMDDQEYLRNGDVSGHIALQFHDEKTNNDFIVGVVIDAFGDLTPVKTLFYRAFVPISDDLFIDENKKIYGTVEFRKHNPTFEYFLTKKEAKKGFRNAFGSINEDFYKLIPKALAFKPIADVKDFIYQNILEEKEIDVTAIKDSIRSYKELENTLKLIQNKINDLKQIEATYSEITSIEDNKDYIEYLMHLFDVEELRREIVNLKSRIEKEETLQSSKKQELADLDGELLSLKERSRELYDILSNNDQFKAEEHINNEILKAQANITSLEANQANFLKRASNFKDIINEIRKFSDEKIYKDAANINLTTITQPNVEEAKTRLLDFQSRLHQLRNKKNQQLGSLDSEKRQKVEEIQEISNQLKSLNNHQINFPVQLIQIKNEIAEGLKRIYNYDINVHILAELCDITNDEWIDAVEIFLGNRRFNMIVEPRYYDQAAQILSRVRNRYANAHNFGLVNTKMITQFTTFEPNSIASIIECENQDARRFINYTCGHVIMCNDISEMENYSTALTKDLMIYSGYTLRPMNPGIQRPFIGKNAASKASEIWNKKAQEAKKAFVEVDDKITSLNKELELLERIDVRPILDDLDKELQLQKEKGTLKDLNAMALRQKNLTPSELQDDYDKVQESIDAIDKKKMDYSMEIGGFSMRIQSLNDEVALKTSQLDALSNDLKVLAKGSVVIEQKAKDEYNETIATTSFKQALVNYQEKYRAFEGSYKTLCESLQKQQFEYVNKYNSMLPTGTSEMPKFLSELNKLEKSELVSYEQKVRQAREAAEVVFKEDFIAKLRNNIQTAEQEIGKINETLSGITFGNDRYEFIFPRSSEYAQFYEMVTSDLVDLQQGLFTYDFQTKYDEQIRELFESLSVDEVNSNAINKFTDYRTYMDYDIRIINKDGGTMTYSKVFKEKSGGETQVPFYVAIIASFVRVYTKNGFGGGDPIGLVMFDEVFDKMDANRMRAMMNFINSMPLQIIIACPPQRMDILRQYAETTLIMVRQGRKASVYPFLEKDTEEDTDESI